MEVQFMTLAPYAEVSPDGKVSMISGDIDALNVRGELPGVSATPLYVVIKVVFPRQECSRRYLSRVAVLGPDGNPVAQTDETPIDPPQPQTGRDTTKVTFLTVLGTVFLPRAGAFRVSFSLDGQERKSIPLDVVLLPNANHTQEGATA